MPPRALWQANLYLSRGGTASRINVTCIKTNRGVRAVPSSVRPPKGSRCGKCSRAMIFSRSRSISAMALSTRRHRRIDTECDRQNHWTGPVTFSGQCVTAAGSVFSHQCMAQFWQAERGHTQTKHELLSFIEAADLKAMKVQIMRYDLMGDFETCVEILGGGRSRLPRNRGSYRGSTGSCGPMAKS